MTRIAMCILAYLLLAACPASAQREPFNAAGVTMGHWHLNSQNVGTNKALFVALGGKAIKPGDFEIVNFPGVSVFLHQRAGTPAPTGGTVGTVINHVGLLVPNVQESFAKWKAAGVPVEMGKDRTNQAWITTVDGLRIEILEDRLRPFRSSTITYTSMSQRRPFRRFSRGTESTSAQRPACAGATRPQTSRAPTCHSRNPIRRPSRPRDGFSTTSAST